MMFGYLAQPVASMPSWVAMHVNQDELDLNPPGGKQYTMEPRCQSVKILSRTPPMTRGVR